jgi:bifunctional non-homologous end joining protein LigD
MGLAEYNRKRDFKVTAEPPGQPPPKRRPGAAPIFVIQKHDASRLHYDFRLEMDGVLLSWSVPKGPSLDPKEKRLAVRTEDHPIAYADFEGIIPKGEYGGGTVLLWDRGTWEPIGDPHAGYAAGNLKFRLAGQKLHGGFALIKLKGRGPARRGDDERSWLLIKERDDAARPESDVSIVTASPESVTTARELDAIAADRSSVWHSNRGQIDPSGVAGAAQGPMPRAFKPAAARVAKAVPDGDDWLHEMEIEGERLLGSIAARKIQLSAVSGRALPAARLKALTPLVDALRMLPVQAALVDGVLTMLRPDGRTTTEGLASALAGGAAKKEARHKNKDADADAGALSYFAFDLLYLDGTDLRGATLEDRKQLLSALIAAGAAEAPLLRLATHINGGGRLFFAEACKVGIPAVVSKRRDHRYQPAAKRAAASWLLTYCTKEAGEKDANKADDAAPASPTKTHPRKSAHPPDKIEGVRLSSPERVLWADLAFTKHDLAIYYQTVARHALPHIVGRPLTLFRCPEGVGKPGAQPCFYMKHANFSVPGNVERIKLRERNEANEYLVIRDLSGLMALVQMSILEIHTWGSQADDVERPDRIVMDLDPDPSVKWEDVVVAAHLIRQRFEAIDLESFVKSTGGKGLHVVAPLHPALSWDETTALSRAVAEEVARGAPQFFTTVMAKDKRKGKILLDYMRNHRGSTAVAAFSTRARAGAPVSFPLSWDQLTPTLDPNRFTVRTVPELVAGRKIDPWARYFRMKQKVSAAARRLLSGQV